MVVYLPRSAWTDVPKPAGLAPLIPDEVRGDGQHWPGGTVDFGGKTREQVARYLEGIRRYHTMPVKDGGRGWTDIAYLQAVDPAGRVWDLRGMEHRSAANGDTGPNRLYGATLWLVGPNEKPTAEQVDAYRAWRTEKWLRRYPAADLVKRHSDVRPEGTACPGPYVGLLVTSGTLTKPPEDDVTEDDKNDIIAGVTKAVVAALPAAVWNADVIPAVGADSATNPTYVAKGVVSGTLKAAVDGGTAAKAAAAAAGRTEAAVKALAVGGVDVQALAEALTPLVADAVIEQLRAHPLTPKP